METSGESSPVPPKISLRGGRCSFVCSPFSCSPSFFSSWGRGGLGVRREVTREGGGDEAKEAARDWATEGGRESKRGEGVGGVEE